MASTPRTLLVAYDGRDAAEAALRKTIIRTSHLSYGTIHVVMIVEPEGGKIRMPDGSLLERWTALDTLRISIAEIVRSWGNKAPGVRISAHLRSGDRCDAIIDLAHQLDVDEIVIGAESKGSQVQVGSLVQALLLESRIPVQVELSMGRLLSGGHQSLHASELIAPKSYLSDLEIAVASRHVPWVQ